jgi:hypothetical protein
MRSVKTLILGIALVGAPAGLYAQATGAAQAVRKSAEQAAAQASAPSNKPAEKPAAKPAAPTPANNNATAPKAQPKPAPQAPPPDKPATPAANGSTQGVKPATLPAAKPAVPGTKPAATTKVAQASGKPVGKKPAVKRVAKSSASGEKAQSFLEKEPRVARRDPFEAMIGREQSASLGSKVLPAGKAGLQVSTLRLDGVVRAPNGMIAVVSNPQSRTYFLREGDQLYDGRVEKIAMDGVSFHEMGKDAFGKPVERQVNKRIYASAGEQQ